MADDKGTSRYDDNPDDGKRNDAGTLAVLYKITRALTHTTSLKELYVNIHDALKTILDAKNFYIALLHPEKDSITFPYYKDEKDEMAEEIFNFSRTASLTGRVIDARRPMIFYEQEIIDFARSRKLSVIGTVSKVWLGAPLVIKDRVIGAVAIQSFDSPDDYRPSDLFLLNTVSQHIALAIERREVETARRDQEKVLETILEFSPVGICLVKNRNFIWVNTQMVKMLGYDSKADLTDKNASVIYATHTDYKAAGRIIQSELKRQGMVDFDYELVRRDGSRFRAHLIITGADKDLQSTIVIIADLSRLETAREERKEKERLHGVLEMAGAVCHEINQPLQTILGYTALFKSPAKIPPKAMAQISEQAARIGKITNRLSRITRYKTMSYPGDAVIFDIWGSSGSQEALSKNDDSQVDPLKASDADGRDPNM